MCFKLKYLEVYDVDNSSSPQILARWAFDGNIDFPNFLPLFLFVVLLAMILIPFSTSLLCIKHVYSLSNCWKRLSWINKLKPFFDTYTGPFKDRARFWTGLLLFVRLFLHIIHAVDFKVTEEIPYYIIVAICVFLSVLMVCLQGVYKRQALNILEYFFIVNMGAIFMINSCGVNSSWISIASQVLVGLAFFAFLGIVAYHALPEALPLGFHEEASSAKPSRWFWRAQLWRLEGIWTDWADGNLAFSECYIIVVASEVRESCWDCVCTLILV